MIRGTDVVKVNRLSFVDEILKKNCTGHRKEKDGLDNFYRRNELQ